MDPISALQVYTAKSHSSLPVYTFSRAADQHQNVFICKVCAFDETAEGRGQSQKDAKKSAATNLMNKLKIDLPDVCRKTKNDLLPEESHLNAVQRLSAYCQKKSLPSPIFEFVECEKALGTNLILHQCCCIVGNTKKFAIHSRKSTAKNLAALDVFNSLIKKNDAVRIEKVIIETEVKNSKYLSDFTMYKEMTAEEKSSLTKLLTNPTKNKEYKDPYKRHNYFKNLLTTTERERVKLISKENFVGSYKEKVDRILGLFGFEYKLRTFESLQVFELESEVDVVIFGTKENIFKDVLEYFVQMTQ